MHVLFLVDAVFEDLPGGSRTAARELARGLAARGHSVTFLAGRQNTSAPAEEWQGGVRIVRYPGAGQGTVFVRAGWAAAAQLWSETPFDLVHTHFAYAAVGPMQALPRSVPRVRTFHGPWDEEGWLEDTQGRTGLMNRAAALAKKQVRGRIETRDLQRSDAVLTLSECFRTLAVERGVSPERVQVVPGGTDTQRFQPAPDPKAARREWGLPPDRKILLSVRRLAPRMGLGNLIAAMPTVLTHYPETLLLIGGKGPDAARLAAQIKQLRLGESVRLLGFVPDEQLPALYCAADLFILPTLALEGFGLVTTEALACGTPAIGTPVGATPEILRTLDPRLVAPSTAPSGLAAAISDYFDGQCAGGWSRTLTPQRLAAFVQNRYTWERHVAATEAVYQSLLDQKLIERI